MTLDEEINQAEDDLTARYKDYARAQIAHEVATETLAMAKRYMLTERYKDQSRAQIAHEVATDTLAMAKRYLDQILAVHAELIRDRDTTSTRAGKP